MARVSASRGRLNVAQMFSLDVQYERLSHLRFELPSDVAGEQVRFFERFRWLVRLGLIGYVLATIGGWVLFGARYDVAYYTLAIELLLIAVLAVSIWRMDGGVSGVLAHLRVLPSDLLDLVRR